MFFLSSSVLHPENDLATNIFKLVGQFAGIIESPAGPLPPTSEETNFCCVVVLDVEAAAGNEENLDLTGFFISSKVPMEPKGF